MSKDLRSFLAEVVTHLPGGLRRVDSAVDRRFGITAYGADAEKRHEFPAFLFTNVTGSDVACVSNLLATRERMALALGTTVEELITGVTRQRQEHPPVEVDAASAPVKQIVWRGDEVDLRRLPIPVHNELDGGPFLTAAAALMRDPESGRVNAGIYRHHVYDDRHMGVWFFGSHHGGTIHRRYAERGEPTPVAIVIGHHPAFLMGAVSRVPGIGGEYEAAGAFLGESVEVVRAETSDLPVPARAEIVLEGVILPGETREEGPFAEWPGHYVGGGPKPVIRIDAVTMRRDAIFQDIQASGYEHRLMGALPRIASIHRNVSQVIPGLKAVNVPTYARMHCYLSIRKEQDNDPVRAAFAALNTEPENLRMVVVVDDDIDIDDEREMAWAIGTRFDAAQDLLVVPTWNGPGGLLPTNWSYDAEGGRSARRSSAVIIDATKPAPPVVFPVRARVPQAAVAAAGLDETLAVTALKELPWLA
ncbi:UbiD family decarboxylase [Streptosporangium sp. NPDC051022]|uniref:UbiD family decarboxylase n=1 Tax=Streptosporangium sp. NPDC051022 TaxID=3155752 RepID=UPI00344571C6